MEGGRREGRVGSWVGRAGGGDGARVRTAEVGGEDEGAEGVTPRAPERGSRGRDRARGSPVMFSNGAADVGVNGVDCGSATPSSVAEAYRRPLGGGRDAAGNAVGEGVVSEKGIDGGLEQFGGGGEGGRRHAGTTLLRRRKGAWSEG